MCLFVPHCSLLKSFRITRKASYRMNVYTADRGPSYANVADNYFGGARSYKDRAGSGMIQSCNFGTSECPEVASALVRGIFELFDVFFQGKK